MAARLFDEAIDHAEAEAGPAAKFLGGEERLEHPAEGIGGHARARVAHAESDILARPNLGVLGRVALVQVGVLGVDGELAAFGHGVAGVHSQVENRALQLVLVHLDRPQPR